MGALNREVGMIVAPDGTPARVSAIQLDHSDAILLRQYKKLLQRYGLREALFCNTCWDGNISDGCDASVTDGNIIIKCRCSLRTYVGGTY